MFAYIVGAITSNVIGSNIKKYFVGTSLVLSTAYSVNTKLSAITPASILPTIGSLLALCCGVFLGTLFLADDFLVAVLTLFFAIFN